MRRIFSLLAVLAVVSVVSAGCSAQPSNDLSLTDGGGGVHESKAQTGGEAVPPSSGYSYDGPSVSPELRGAQEGAAGKDAAYPAPTPSAKPGAPAGVQTTGISQLDLVGRKVISSGSVALEVQAVQSALTQVRGIAESVGGFVEMLSSSGDPEHQHATITIRVPQTEFFTVMERLQALGKVQRQDLGSQDVSEQYIDLEARLKSLQRQEASYLALLAKATSINDVVNLEQQLAKVRSEIERLQGQMAYLDRRVALASIAVTLSPPAVDLVKPPSAALTLEVKKVGLTATEIKQMVSVLQGAIDSSSTSLKDGQETASISFRVYAADFEKAMTTLEGKGTVTSKDVREGGTIASDAPKPEKPNARIQVNIVKDIPAPFPWLAAGIGVVTMVVTFGLLAFLYTLIFRGGRGRRQASQPS